ncbi:MAG TPA: ABC transporter ATP-binding protein [Clostridia bacterium]|nr:ABC transporter ATP-binding protein [Clostridia bacterium]
MPRGFLINKQLPSSIQKKADEMFDSDEPPLFAVVGDLTLNGCYGQTALFITSKKLIVFDESNSFTVFLFDRIQTAEVKRMYGNAVFKIVTKDGRKRDVFRFTYSVADLCDAAAVFINKINSGGSVENELELVRTTYLNRRSFCQKCGRKLPSPDAECINCTSKSKLVSKLAVYVKPQKNKILISLALSIIATAMALVPPYVTKIMVDDILPGNDKEMLLITVSALFLVYIFQHVIGAFRSYLLRRAGDCMMTDLKKDIYAKAQYLPMSFYDKTSTGRVINRVNSDTNKLQSFMLRVTQEAIVQLFMLVGIVTIMFTMDWQLTLLSLIPVPLVVVISGFFGKKIAPMYRRIWRRSSAISSLLADTIPGVRVIKTFTSEQRAIKKFERYNDDFLKESKRAAKTSTVFPQIITFLMTSGSVIIWFVGGMWVIDNPEKMTLGLLVSFISYTSMFYAPINFFANLNDTYQDALASAEKILDIINAEPENDFGKGRNIEKIEGKIEFKNVNFSFDRSKKVLDNVNFEINPGDIIGVVGTTGSGKSTIINLIMRFYDAYEGDILIDGKNIKDIDLEHYRSQIGFVQQEPLMFRDTIYNNIAYSEPEAHIEQVLHAADIANAHGFVSKMPDTYDTMLGERGVGLSGGEKQRVSIARAVLKNPSILIFDEATSAVDSQTEKLIQEAIERIIRNRTTIMIAHRLSTLRKANRIFVVDEGRIIENGTHNELMDLKGKYYKLIQIQSMSEHLTKQREAEKFEVMR